MTICSVSAKSSITTERDPPSLFNHGSTKLFTHSFKSWERKSSAKVNERAAWRELFLERSVLHKRRRGGCIKTDMLTRSPPPPPCRFCFYLICLTESTHTCRGWLVLVQDVVHSITQEVLVSCNQIKPVNESADTGYSSVVHFRTSAHLQYFT